MTLAVKPNFNMTTTYIEPENFPDYLSHDNNYCLFLDIDGTLAEFTLDPKDSFIPQSTLTLIQEIQNSGVQIAMVTGRSLAEAKQMVSPLQLPIAATHGLEIDFVPSQDKVNSNAKDSEVKSAINIGANSTSDHINDNLSNNNLSAAAFNTSELNTIHQRITQSCLPYNGFTIENKPYSCALHYRQNPSLADIAYDIMLTALQHYPNWTLKQGKYVWEAIPKGVNKGTAILTLLGQMQNDTTRGRSMCPIFIGDDITDEAGFMVIQDENRLVKGLGIKVGTEPTAANYCVNDINEVAILLGHFLTFCQGQTAIPAALNITETNVMTTDHSTDNNTANHVL